VIGIDKTIASPIGASVGIGFAIPIITAMKIADELIRHGTRR
jgi:S1-C subfamily serine protease